MKKVDRKKNKFREFGKIAFRGVLFARFQQASMKKGY